MSRFFRFFLFTSLILIVIGCGGGGGGGNNSSDDSSSVSPEGDEVRPVSISTQPENLQLTAFGELAQFTVSMEYSDGSRTNITAADTGTVYMTASPGIVSVTGDGEIKCIGIGDTVLNIRNSGVSGSLVIKADVPPAEPESVTLTALNTLKQTYGETIKADWNVKNGLPRTLLNTAGYLSEPSDSAPLDILKNFLAQREDLYHLSTTELENFSEAGNYTSDHNGVRHLNLMQQYQGIPVHGGQIQANINRNGQLINIVGDYYPGIAISMTPTLSATEALIKAAKTVSPSIVFEPVIISGPDNADHKTVFEKGPFQDEHHVSLVVFPVMTEYRLCWEVELRKSRAEAYFIIIDALNGAIFSQVNAVQYDVELPRGLVFETDPDDGPQTMVSFAGDAEASPYGWVTEHLLAHVTNGSEVAQYSACGVNVIAGADPTGTFGQMPTEFLHLDSPDFAFEFENAYRITGGLDGAPDMEAAIVNVFYWANMMHDYFFYLGFDEAAGNFQLINFSTGVQDWDPVLVYVQYGRDSAEDTFLDEMGAAAAFSTSPNGHPGYMMVDICVTNQPNDYAFEAGLVIHEYTHGVSCRLCGGAQTGSATSLNTVQASALAEGWSEFFAASYLDNPVLHKYYDPPGVDIRLLGDFTFGMIGFGPDGPECHLDGYIWTATLWDLREAFIAHYGHAQGKQIVEQLIIDAMKLSPVEPTWLNMRDFILLADVENNAAQNHDIIWPVFASRGMGFSAATIGPDDADPSEAFDLPPYYQSIEITNGDVDLDIIGAVVQLDVIGTLYNDTVENLTASDSGTTYASSNGEVVSVSAEGLATALAEGNTVVTATNGILSDSITITVSTSAAAILESIEITNEDFSLTASGATRQLSVLGHYSDGGTQDVTSSASGTTYVSSNPAVATVSAEGLVTAAANGHAVITATNSSYTGSVEVDVAIESATDLVSITISDNSLLFTEIGHTQQIQVMGHFADGSQEDVTASTSGTTYQSSRSDVATVSTEGLVTAVAPGATTITATNDGQDDGIVTVVAVPAKSLVFLGEADTTDSAQSLAIYGDYAYVCGSQHITIIDISDPMQPVVQGTFGESAYTYSKCDIIGNHLVVSFNWTMVNVYALENPLAPELVGVEDTGYCNVSGTFTRGNNLFVNTIIAGWNSYQDIVLVRGDVVAFDLIDPTTPVQADILYDTYQSFHPEWPGSNYMVGRGQALSDEVALVPTTTGATAATDGIGKVVVVDISDPTALTPLTDVEIPGTKVLTGIGSLEDHSLAVGSTGAFDYVDRFMLTGNLVLTSLDVSTPDTPLVIRTRNTDFQANMSVQVTAGINQCYAMSNTIVDTQWMAAVVDARDPVNPESITLPVALPLADIRLSDQLMYAVDIEGLKIFDLSAIVFTPHTCSVFAEYAPALDAEVHVVAGQGYSSFTYAPGVDASTDVSFELHFNGTYVADIREVLPSESVRVVPLPDNLITVGENIIKLINPNCTVGYGSCEDGLVSWGGSACLTDRESDPILWFERNEAPLDISAEFEAQDQAYTFFIRPGPLTCTQVICDVYLNGQVVAEKFVMPVESESEQIIIHPVTGTNTIELRLPRCTPGEGCCPIDGTITSWAGTLNISSEAD